MRYGPPRRCARTLARWQTQRVPTADKPRARVRMGRGARLMSRFCVAGSRNLHCRRRELWFADDLQLFSMGRDGRHWARWRGGWAGGAGSWTALITASCPAPFHRTRKAARVDSARARREGRQDPVHRDEENQHDGGIGTCDPGSAGWDGGRAASAPRPRQGEGRRNRGSTGASGRSLGELGGRARGCQGEDEGRILESARQR